MVFCQGGLVKRALVVVAVTGLCLMGTAPAWAVFPGANGRITYSAYGGIIHTILPSGHGDTVIAPQTSTDPAWSPTGRRLTFTGDPEGFGGQPDIYTMRADGSDVRRLTFESEDTASGGAWHPSYSPGGGRIAFSLWHYRSEQIATIRNDGSHRRVIASWGEAGRAPIGVVWSPSGEVAYVLGIGGSPTGRPSIFAMRSDGTHKHHLVDLGRGGGFGPVYSPDGGEFLFSRVWRDGSVHTRLAERGRKQHPKAAVRAHPRPDALALFVLPDGAWVLARNVNQDTGAASLVRVSLRSCRGKRVVGHFGGSADWQALPDMPPTRVTGSEHR